MFQLAPEPLSIRLRRQFSCFGLLVLATIPLACSDDATPQNQSTSGGTVTATTTAGTTSNTSSVTTTTGGTTTASSSSSAVSSSGMTTSSSTVTSTTSSTTGTATTGIGTTGTATTGTTGGGTGGTGSIGMTGAGGSMTGAGGASAMGTDGTGGTGNNGFAPCPETGPCKVLPLGDSITVGLNFDGGYRVNLFHLAVQDGHEITFTGTQAPNGPSMVDGMPFPRNHEGISGQTIQQIAGRVPSPALNDMPHIILLHAGTNDMVQGANGADMRLGQLMDKLITEAPDALIVVSNIIPLPLASSAVDTFNATVEPMVNERANAGKHILFVDQFTGFDPGNLPDNVHPNEVGYNQMADRWYEAIEPYLR